MPKKWEAKTSRGVTNSAICRLDPMAMLRLKSILFLSATITAVDSPALPMIETMMTPTKASVRPRLLQADSTDPARNSLRIATRRVATARMPRAFDMDQTGAPAETVLFSSTTSPRKEFLVGDQGKDHPEPVGGEKHRGDGEGKMLFGQRRPLARPLNRRGVKDGGDDKADRRQTKGRSRDADAGLVEFQVPKTNAASQHGDAENHQDITEDRTNDRGLDDGDQAFCQGHERDDQFGGVAERGIKQAADAWSRAFAKVFRRPAHPSGQRNDRQPGDEKEHGVVAPGRNKADRKSRRNRDQEPVERLP